MSDDPAPFAKEVTANWVDYHECAAPWKPVSAQRTAEHLRYIFPWLRIPDDWFSRIWPTCHPGDLVNDGLVVLPTLSALARGISRTRTPSYGELFKGTAEFLMHSLPRVSMQAFDGFSPEYLVRNPHDYDLALELEKRFASGDLMRPLVQMGRAYGGCSPRNAYARMTRSDQLIERPMCVIQSSILASVHIREHGYVPAMRMDCPTVMYAPSGNFQFADNVRVDTQGNAIVFDWNWNKRDREFHGAPSIYFDISR